MKTLQRFISPVMYVFCKTLISVLNMHSLAFIDLIFVTFPVSSTVDVVVHIGLASLSARLFNAITKCLVERNSTDNG